jgi:hypothetical protein
MNYCFYAYLNASLWTFNLLLNSPLFTAVLPCGTLELATTFHLVTGGIVGWAVLTTAITCQNSRTYK